jgi:hypothetical protein
LPNDAALAVAATPSAAAEAAAPTRTLRRDRSVMFLYLLWFNLKKYTATISYSYIKGNRLKCVVIQQNRFLIYSEITSGKRRPESNALRQSLLGGDSSGVFEDATVKLLERNDNLGVIVSGSWTCGISQVSGS